MQMTFTLKAPNSFRRREGLCREGVINYKFIQTKWLIVGAREGSESFLLDDVAEAFLGISNNPT